MGGAGGGSKNIFTQRSPLPTWILLLALFLLITALFVPAIQYWHAKNLGWASCVYGRADCSLSVATYLLCGLSAFAITVSVKALYDTAAAANYAAKRLQHQQTAVLATQKCGHELCLAMARHMDLYILSLNGDPLRELNDPELTEGHEFFDTIQVDCLSVGLAPILNGILHVAMIGEKDGTRHTLGKIELGTLGSNERLHLGIKALDSLAGHELDFFDAEHEIPGEPGKLEKLAYHRGPDKFSLQVSVSAANTKAPPEQTEPTPAA
jgi:hypothetical protein